MEKTTTFFKKDGTVTHIDKPIERIAQFDQKTIDVEIIGTTTFSGDNVQSLYFTKDDQGNWCSPLKKTSDGYTRIVLASKGVNYVMKSVSVPEEDGQKIIAKEVDMLIADAKEAISWCDPKDENDADGRYWLAAYRGSGVYRLIVKDGKIHGAIYGGFHDCAKSIKAAACSSEAFMMALEKVITEKICDGFHLLKADGSGTYFYLRYDEDKCFLETKEYDVPSVDGGTHKNIEIV